MTRLRAALTALALTVTVLLSGCSQGAPTTAAVVNGVVITESTVETLTSQFPTITNSNGKAIDHAGIRTLVVRYLVLGEVARDAAARQNLNLGAFDFDGSATDDESKALVASPAGRQILTDVYAWQTLRGKPATQDAATGKVDTSAREAALRLESVTLNPRYGTWDVAAAAQLSALSTDTGSLSGLSLNK